ncbi:hypothetical protein EC973_006038 [Apophysomyces ossiformis]|uniref:Yeast cell wall synthesis Kre9/Knh1-like N-terminal domain-containing protein n=1 Tax=Apophysomyces ossiformis TaxID=679940 RepID=A0A8H7ERV9_9FUNG|nr:hypothetical protein EC973_006038 [Apophysomyces ossiformis]
MKSILATIAALALAVVSADNIVTITFPLEGQTFKAGSEANINWINPQVSTIPRIVLAKGPATGLQVVATVQENVPAAPGTFKWTIPADTPAGNDYAFELGVSPNISYTGHFSIQAGNGAASGNSSSASTGATSSGSATSASASASATVATGSSTTTVAPKSTTTTAPVQSPTAASSGNGASTPSGNTGSTSASPSASQPTNAGFKANPATLGALAIAGAAAVALI